MVVVASTNNIHDIPLFNPEITYNKYWNITAGYFATQYHLPPQLVMYILWIPKLKHKSAKVEYQVITTHGDPLQKSYIHTKEIAIYNNLQKNQFRSQFFTIDH